MLICIVEQIKSHYLEISAIIVSVFSVLYAFQSNKISKEALRIAKQDFENKKSNFYLYLIDSFRYRINKGINTKKILIFNLTINNKSELQNTFKAILEIEFVRKDNTVARIIIDHNPSLSKIIAQKRLTIFKKDIQVIERGMITNWLLFEQPLGTFDDHKIDKYTIKVIDIHNNEQKAVVSLLKDIEYEI